MIFFIKKFISKSPIVIGLLAFLTPAFGFECLDRGWPGYFEEDICVLDSENELYTKQRSKFSCQNNSLPCNPSLFSSTECVAPSKSHNACLKNFSVGKTVDDLLASQDLLEFFDSELFSFFQIACDKDFGDERNALLCKEIQSVVQKIGDELNRRQNVTVRTDGLEQSIESSEQIMSHLNGEVSTSSLGESRGVDFFAEEAFIRNAKKLPINSQESQHEEVVEACEFLKNQQVDSFNLELARPHIAIIKKLFDSGELKTQEEQVKAFCLLKQHYETIEDFDSLIELFLKTPEGEGLCQ